MYELETYYFPSGNTFLFVFFVFAIYFLDIFKSTQNALVVKTRKLQSLVKLVNTQYKNIFMILWVCMCIIAKNTYIVLCQKLNKTVVKIDKHSYEVTYVINGIQYIMHIQVKKGPKTLIQALDKDDNDITDVLQSYLGPMENFHGYPYTPEFFGTSEITISLSTGEELTFKNNDVITL